MKTKELLIQDLLHTGTGLLLELYGNYYPHLTYPDTINTKQKV